MQCLSYVILCGGMSRRMGQDKGSMIINEKPMIIHILDKCKPEIDDVIIVLMMKVELENMKNYNSLPK